MSLMECTKPMVDSPSSLAYTSYTHFFTHAESMCFYLQSKSFQRSTESLIGALQSTSHTALDRLGELGQQTKEQVHAARQLLAGQQAAAAAAAEQERRLTDASMQLTTLQATQSESFGKAQLSIDGLSNTSRAALLELKRDTEELGNKQRSLIGGLDQLLSLQSSLLGEFIGFKTAIAVVCGAILATLFTSMERTAEARYPLFALVLCNAFLEKMLIGLLCGSADATESAYAWLWRLRNLNVLALLIVLLVAARRYTDKHRQTHAKLERIEHRQESMPGQLHEHIREYMKEFRQAQDERDEELMSTVRCVRDGVVRLEAVVRQSASASQSPEVAHGARRRRARSPAARAMSPKCAAIGVMESLEQVMRNQGAVRPAQAGDTGGAQQQQDAHSLSPRCEAELAVSDKHCAEAAASNEQTPPRRRRHSAATDGSTPRRSARLANLERRRSMC